MKPFGALIMSLALLGACATPALNAAETPLRADALRTPDTQFVNLPGYPFEPNYVAVEGYRIHYVDEGDRDAAPVLMMHGEPTWSYLYRKMIPIVAQGGHRVIAPDLIGFGRSDKPKSIATHTYKFHVDAMKAMIEQLDLRNITLVCQDWGSLIGLRVAAEMPDRFSGIVLANGALPTGTPGGLSPAFNAWRASVVKMQEAGDMPVGQAFQQHGPAIVAAYAAPFPDPSYKAGPLALPLLVPVTPDDPASAANERAWDVFREWDKPFLTAFSDGDPITRGGDARFLAEVPGTKGQKHTTVKGGGHFLQEDKGEELAAIVLDFLTANR